MTKASVIKHNNLIDIRDNLSPLPQKLMMVFISLIQHNFKDPDSEIIEDSYKITTKDLYAFLGLDKSKNARQRIVQASRELNKPVLIQSLDKKQTTYAYWLQDITFNTEGYVQFKFGEKLHGYLIKMKRDYTQYQLVHSMALKSSYSLKLFEFFKRWAFTKVKTIEVSELRKLLGVKENEYPQYFDFKKNCLTKPIAEIEKETELQIGIREIKAPKSKRIDKISFIIGEKSEGSRVQKQLALLEPTPASKNELIDMDIEDIKKRFYNPKNSPDYNMWYALFMKHKHNYPETWNFKEFLQNEHQAEIILNPNQKGGWDIKFPKVVQLKAEL